MFVNYGTSFGVNHAANLPAYDSKDLQIIFGTMVSEYVIAVYRRTLNLHLILQIDSSLDLCKTITYLCEDDTGIADMADTALDGPIKEQFIPMPKIRTFHGFMKGGFRHKLAIEQLECIYQQDILRNWFNNQLAQAIENGRQALMARWYRELLVHAHPKNSGNNAGMMYGGHVVGQLGSPVMFNPDTADDFFMQVLAVIKEMPRVASPTSEWNRGIDGDAFIFAPSIMENILMQSDKYLRYDSVGNCACANCGLFKDVFTCSPRGITILGGDCVESYTCVSGGVSHTVYPILFGRRYKGAKAALRIKSHRWITEDQQSVFYQTIFYHHMYVYDPRFLGLGYIIIEDRKPPVVTSCNSTATP